MTKASSPYKKFGQEIDFSIDYGMINTNPQLHRYNEIRKSGESDRLSPLRRTSSVRKQETTSVRNSIRDSINQSELTSRKMNNSTLSQRTSVIQNTGRQSVDISILQRPIKKQKYNFKRVQQSQNTDKQAYQELLQKVADSHMTLRKVKNGQAIFSGDFMKEGQNIPFLKKSDLQKDLKSYLKSGEIFIPQSLQPLEDIKLPDPSKLQMSFQSSMMGPPTKKITMFKNMNKRDILQKMRARSTVIELQDPPPIHELKDLNKLDPVCITERKVNKSLEKKLQFPKNPTFQVEDHYSNQKLKFKKLMSFVDFCKMKNIPFCENEQRLYEFLRNQQNHKYWVENWKKFCKNNFIKKPEYLEEKQAEFLTLMNNQSEQYNRKSIGFSLPSSPRHLRKNISTKFSDKSSSPIKSPSKIFSISEKIQEFSPRVDKLKKMQNQKIHRKLDRLLDMPISHKKITEQANKYPLQVKQKLSKKKEINYYQKFDQKRKSINDNLLKILERVDLDRPILLKEKFEVLWNFDRQIAEKDIIQREIEKRKVQRCKMNKFMADKYNEILEYINKRFIGMKNQRGIISQSQKPLECERKFMDFLRIIIEGGWVVRDKMEWIQILEFLEIDNDFSNNHQAAEFFREIARIFDFENELDENFMMYEL